MGDKVVPIREPVTRESIADCHLQTVAFLDGRGGMAKQIRRCVEHPRLGRVWHRKNRKDEGRSYYTVDGIECANLEEAIERLNGPPQQDESMVARINRAAAEAEEREAEKKRRPMHTLPAPCQAALLGNERRFWRFLAERRVEFVIDKYQAREAIMRLCGCRESRAELAPGSEPASRWHELFADYEIWRKDLA